MTKTPSTKPQIKRPHWLRPSVSTTKPKVCGAGVVVASFKVPSNAPPPPNPGQALNVYPSSNHGSVCWWDSHEFSTPPVGCPIHHDSIRNEFHLQGYFCSWSCARAYAAKYVSYSTGLMVPFWMRSILQQSGATKTDPPPAAPHWSVLTRFGGSMSIDEYRALESIRESTGVALTVVPEQARVFMAGFDCFLEDPRIKCPPFMSNFESRVIKRDPDGFYVFPQFTRRADPRTVRSTVHENTQTPTTAADYEAGPADKVIVPFAKAKAPTASKSRRAGSSSSSSSAATNQIPPSTSVQTRRKSKNDAIKYIKTSKAMKRSLNQGPESIYRQFRVNNPVVRCMNIHIGSDAKNKTAADG